MNRYPLTEREILEREFGLQIRRKLNASTAGLDKHVTESLFTARQAALAAYPQSRTAAVSVGRGLLSWSVDNLRPFAMAAVLVLTMISGNYMMSVQHIEETEEVDSALLADDLPINAYLDSGFGSWLADSSQH